MDPDLQPRLDAQVKEAAKAQFLHRGHLEGGVFSSDALGLTAEIQADTAATVPPDGAELELKRRGTHGRRQTAALGGSIYFLFELLTTELETEVTEKLARRVQPGAAGPVRVRASYAIKLSVGVVDVDEVELEDDAEMKVAFVPACGGAATLVLLGAWAGPQGDAATEQWFDRVRLDEAAPACAYITAHAAPTAASAGAPSTE
ncbi:MAG TPA: hypothetical protein VF765_37595 [Polyangiaceae bacterium]